MLSGMNVAHHGVTNWISPHLRLKFLLSAISCPLSGRKPCLIRFLLAADRGMPIATHSEIIIFDFFKSQFMRKIILQEWMSLDGFVEDKNGQLDFFTNISAESNKYSDFDQLKLMENIDTVLLGRKTYDLFVEFWPTATTDVEIIADKLNSTNKLIFSNSLESAPWGKWTEAKIIKGEATDKIRELKLTAGKNMVLWGSISLAQSLMKQNLIDEYYLHLCPTVLGGGKPLFPESFNHVNMNLIELKKYETGVVLLRYEHISMF